MMHVKVLASATLPDDPAARIETVELPDGFYRVYRGSIKPGDLYLNAVLFCDDGIESWSEVEPACFGDWLYGQADAYLCLIRRGSPVDEPCERCEVEARKIGYRFCGMCCHEVVRNHRVFSE